jgi:RND family efflux transporter MFP subunit
MLILRFSKKNKIMKILKYSLFIIIFLVACGDKKNANNNATPPPLSTPADSTETEQIELTKEQMELMHIELGVSVPRNLSGSIEAQGKIVALAGATAEIAVPMRGTLSQIFVTEGKYVKKGETIAELVCPEVINLQQDFLKAQSELFFLEKELERQRAMQQEQVGAARNLQEVQAKVMAQTAILRTTAARLRLLGIGTPSQGGDIAERVRLVAPISGFVDKFSATLGGYLSEGARVVRIIGTDNMKAEIFVFERDMQRLRVGQRVHLRPLNGSAEELNGGIVESIGREIDPTRRTLSALVRFEMPKNRFVASEMQIAATIETEQISTPALPENAVIEENHQFFYFQAADTEGSKNHEKFVFKKTQFKPIGKGGGFVGITSGDKNIRYVVKGTNVLQSELKMRNE